MAGPLEALPESVARRIPPEAVAFRQTFLRRHVPAVLGDVRDVLAVKVLVERADRPVSVQERAWLLDEFFENDRPEQRLWMPVRLRPTGSPPSGRLDTLSDLLADFKDRSSAGILLAARTGAGKTLAALKAFRDCFLPVPDYRLAVDEAGCRAFRPPPLAGYLPLWLPVTAPVPVVGEMREAVADGRDPGKVASTQADRLLGELMLAAAGLDACDWRCAKRWVTDGPPLLLFADLNAAGDLIRRCLAHALGHWQVDHGQARRHRIVVTYRSALDDAVVNTVLGLAPIQRLDLEPIDAEQAVNYLLGYRDLERRFLKERAPRRTISPQAESEALGNLVRRHAADRQSLISTPLLMHFATIREGGLDQVRTVSDLYDRVVDESLGRDLRHIGEGGRRIWPDPLNEWVEGTRLVKVVMTRVALAILASGPEATRLAPTSGRMKLKELFTRLVIAPRTPLPGSSPWTHPDPFWEDGPYQENSQAGLPDHHRPEDKLLIEALLELGLFRFRIEEHTLGFVHDSLLYYFAGKVALRDHLGPACRTRKTSSTPPGRGRSPSECETTRRPGSSPVSSWALRCGRASCATSPCRCSPSPRGPGPRAWQPCCTAFSAAVPNREPIPTAFPSSRCSPRSSRLRGAVRDASTPRRSPRRPWSG